MKITKYLCAILLAGTLTACGDSFLEPEDSNVASSEAVQEESSNNPDKVLGSQLDGVYQALNMGSPFSTGGIADHQSQGLVGVMMLSNNMSNDISLYMDGDPWHYDKQLDYYAEIYVRAMWPWNLFYTVINRANAIIPLISEDATNIEVRATLGQALALRGLSYYYLAQYYQDTYVTSKNKPCVPLLLESLDGSITSRATVEQVYAQIETDLLKAITLLDGWKRDSKALIDQQVAKGLLARVYLMMHKWTKAAELANQARQGYALMDVVTAETANYQDINNSEVMWGLDITDINSRIYASFQSWMCATDMGYGGQVGCFQLIDAKLYSTMPENDVRRRLFVAPGTTLPTDAGFEVPGYANLKFKKVENWLGDYVYMRSAEMYLTEAEALVRLNRADEAYQVLSELMVNRRTDGKYEMNRATIEEVQKQRRLELWGEGFSYYDHRRWQMDMDRGYEGTNEHRSAWPAHPGYSNGFVPWYHYSWRFQLPQREINENEDISPEDQNVVGEEGNQDPVADKITDWSEK